MITLDDGYALIKLARQSIITYFSGKAVSFPDIDILKKEQGVFVTLKKYSGLRGCIGFPEPVYGLDRAIVESARSAAFHDPRFSPVSEQEMHDITIEITVLSVPELIEVQHPKEYMDVISIGKHGLIIRYNGHSGLLLPQVFTEYGCTPKEALEMVCEKAGLPNDSWKEEGAKIYAFSGQIFEELEPEGKVIEKDISI